MADSNKSGGAEGKGGGEKAHVPGEGIRSLKTSNAFRALNFELYARPNKYTMSFGILGITIATSVLLLMNYRYDREKFYEATNEDGTLTLRPKKSRWE